MSLDMNKTIEEASLGNMHDILVSDPVGFFPLAPGWIIVFVLLLALFFHFALKSYKHYKKSQYRRDALSELNRYEEYSKENSTALLLLAKRVAIAAYGREKVVKYYDNSWWEFIEKHSKAHVPGQAREGIVKLLYDESYVMDQVLQDNIRTFVTLWIKTHKVESDD